ncbi:MAG: hypothetical protein J5744_01370, partial [Oscillospiraceae bacterium]|nr:hypothetical protein [Oscillospiraceae bacterium]
SLAGVIRECGYSAVACHTTEEGISAAISLAGGGAVCCVGSLYLAGTVRRCFSPDTSFTRLV